MATISRGIKAPIIREGDDIVSIVCDCVLSASKEQGFTLRDRDVVAVTEAVVARAAGNYATVDAIAEDVRRKLGGNTIGLVFPILSRNRFAICLRGIARGARKVVVQLGYPSDEVGNHLVDIDALDDSGIDPYKDVLSVAEFRRHFGTPLHPFTGVDYISYYTQLIEEEGAEAFFTALETGLTPDEQKKDKQSMPGMSDSPFDKVFLVTPQGIDDALTERLLEKARYHFDAERCTSLDEAIGLARANSRRGLLICGSEAIALEAEQKLEAR